MTRFTLDTSGEVWRRHGPKPAMGYRWSDLSPFAQGYVEAAWLWAYHDGAFASAIKARRRDLRLPAFSDLAPETLARIRKDCAAERARADGPPDTQGSGAAFWVGRNTRTTTNEYHATGFPPLTPYLGDDGKVYLREAS